MNKDKAIMIAYTTIVSAYSKGKVLSSTSIVTSSPGKVEQLAIALVLLDPSKTEVYTDSRSAARAFT